jgi:hemoglobin-like flavoprotein
MSGVTKEVLKAWFNAYKDVVKQLKIEEKDIYNMDETGFSIRTMEST